MTTPSSASRRAAVVDVIIPARDAEATLGDVLARLPHRQLRTVMVVDNGSADGTSQVARDAGVVVLRESRGGLGAACLHAIERIARLPQPPDVVAFVPADGSVDPEALPELLAPVADGSAELAVAVPTEGVARADRLVAKLIGAVYRQRVRGVGGPSAMRAIRLPALVALGMSDRGGGWEVEMIVRALKIGLAVVEVPVDARGAPAERALTERAAARGRSLFHILRHATLR